MHKLWRSGSLDFDDSVARDPVAHRLRTALRHQEVFGSDQASATLLHKRESAVPSPISSVTPSHCSYTQGKARPDMCTTRRTWTNASMDGVRDEREKRREQVS